MDAQPLDDDTNEVSSEPFHTVFHAINRSVNISDLMERELLLGEQVFLQFAIEMAADEVFWMASDSTLLYVNQAACETLGYSKEELIGLHVWDWDPNFTRSLWPKTLEMFRNQKHIRFETQHRTKSGDVFPVEVQGHYYHVEGNEYLVAFVNNISERHRALKVVQEQEHRLARKVAEQTNALQQEKALIEKRNVELQDLLARLSASEELLERVGNVANIGGWELDVKNNRLTWSKETCRLHGLQDDYTPDLATAIDFYDGDEARAQVTEVVNRALTTHQGWDLELPLRKANGERIWVRAFGEADVQDGQVVRLYGAFQDTTEQYQMRQQLARTTELLSMTLGAISEGVITTDIEGRITWMNVSSEHMTGYRFEEAKSQRLCDIYKTENTPTGLSAFCPVKQALQSGRSVNRFTDVTLVAKNQRRLDIADSCNLLVDNCVTRGAVLLIRDISEQKQLHAEISHRATHDTLTDLLNRSEFERRLSHVLRNGGRHILLFIDLDHFKLVNDTCGHAAGDACLIEVSRLFKEKVRTSDIVARMGGDEFAVLLINCEDTQGKKIATALNKTFNEFRFEHANRKFQVGASIGLVAITDSWSDIDSLMQTADVACYAAKSAGRNQVHVWNSDDASIESVSREVAISTRITEALDGNFFTLMGQRVVGVNDRSLPVVEVLIRLHDSEGRFIYPNEFLPVAERFHYAPLIDLWVIQSTLALIIANPRSAQYEFSINLCGQSLSSLSFQMLMIKLLEEVDSDTRSRLSFEIDESLIKANLLVVSNFVDLLQKQGVQVVLDSTESGLSTFDHLKTLKIDALKLSGDYTKRLNDPVATIAIRSLIEAADHLGVRTVAKEIEEETQAERMSALGVDYLQGFYIHKPESLLTLLNRASTNL